MYHTQNTPMKWRRFNGETVEENIVSEVKNLIMREYNAGYKLKVCIGTDSQVTHNITEFATVIVFVRQKRGGFMLISSEKTKYKFAIKERMLYEVSRSIEIAYQVCEVLDKYQV